MIWDFIKILKEHKEDSNHDKEMTSSLNEYNLDDQTLKLIKRERERGGEREVSPCAGIIKRKMAPPMLVMVPPAFSLRYVSSIA